MDDQKNIRPDFSKAGWTVSFIKKKNPKRQKREVKGTAWKRQSVVSGSLLWITGDGCTCHHRDAQFSGHPLLYAKKTQHLKLWL